MPSETPSLTHFPTLPKEIRLLIWEKSLTPQLLPITTTILPFYPTHAPPSLYLLGGDPLYTHFTLADQDRPNEPYYNALSTPSQSHPPALLSTCSESRDVALAAGYIPWILHNEKRQVKKMMWNPNIDVLFFTPQPSRAYFMDEIPLFTEQHPDQTKLIQRLAVVSSWWHPQTNRGRRDFHYGGASVYSTDPKTLLPFGALQDLVMVVDEEGEREKMRGALEMGRAMRNACEVLGDWKNMQAVWEMKSFANFEILGEIVNVLGRKEKDWVDGYGRRESRIVLGEEDILRGFSFGMELMAGSGDDF